LQSLLWRLCSQMLDPPHCLQPLLWRLCSQMLDQELRPLLRYPCACQYAVYTRFKTYESGTAPEASEYVRIYCDSIYECAQTHNTHIHTFSHNTCKYVYLHICKGVSSSLARTKKGMR
jgi:hypothetical protein